MSDYVDVSELAYQVMETVEGERGRHWDCSNLESYVDGYVEGAAALAGIILMFEAIRERYASGRARVVSKPGASVVVTEYGWGDEP